MGFCLCIAVVCLDRIGSSFGFYMCDYECMDMYYLTVLFEWSTHIKVHTHTHINNDLVNREALNGVLKCIP